MNFPDPVGGQLIAESIQATINHGEYFIAAAMGHPREELGTILGTTFRRRLRNLSEIGSKAHLTLLNIGVEPVPVPLRIIQPLAEGASLEEDVNLKDKWANLMANAADPRQRNPVEPCFPAILKELSGREVRFLDTMFERSNGLMLNLNRTGLQVEFCNAGLSRNPAIIPVPPMGDAIAGEDLRSFQLMMDVIVREEIFLRSENTQHGTYVFTQLGRDFVHACRKPQP
jgi:Abortive infection alpha